jgi:ClpP class serine protease
MTPFLFEILSSSWLLHADNPDVYGAALVSLLRGDRISSEDYSKARELNRPFVVSGSSNSQVPSEPLNSKNISQGSIAVIPIRGIIMKDDVECGPRGSASMTKDIKSADANPNIKSILLVVSSPGGTTSYTDILSEAVTNCSKPVVAFVEGMAASAAYWIISGASKIICSSDLDTVGSIGTMLEYMDMKPYFEKAGVVIHEVYATLSTEKNQHLSDLRAGKYDDLRKNLLDRINSKFHATVTANRPFLDASSLTGKTYFASDAIALGLIDAIGSYEYALEQADAIPSTKSSTIPINSNPVMKIKMLATWAAIAAFFNFTDDITGKELTEEMVGQVNDKLADLTKVNADQAGQIVQLNENLSTANSAVAEITRQFDAFRAQDAAAETLRGKSADKSEDTIISDNYLHNIMADRNS